MSVLHRLVDSTSTPHPLTLIPLTLRANRLTVPVPFYLFGYTASAVTLRVTTENGGAVLDLCRRYG